VREIVRRLVDDRAMAVIETQTDQGPITWTDVTLAAEGYEPPATDDDDDGDKAPYA
jgi:hypothetical protein